MITVFIVMHHIQSGGHMWSSRKSLNIAMHLKLRTDLTIPHMHMIGATLWRPVSAME